MRIFDINFNDLTPQAQADYLSFMGLDTPEEVNADLVPIASIEVEDDGGDPQDDLDLGLDDDKDPTA